MTTVSRNDPRNAEHAAWRCEVERQIIDILGNVQLLRLAAPPPAYTGFSRMSDIHLPIRNRESILPDDPPERSYYAGLRLWARQVAPRIRDLGEFQEIAEATAYDFRPFQGDPIRYVENLFVGLQLANGATVTP